MRKFSYNTNINEELDNFFEPTLRDQSTKKGFPKSHDELKQRIEDVKKKASSVKTSDQTKQSQKQSSTNIKLNSKINFKIEDQRKFDYTFKYATFNPSDNNKPLYIIESTESELVQYLNPLGFVFIDDNMIDQCRRLFDILGKWLSQSPVLSNQQNPNVPNQQNKNIVNQPIPNQPANNQQTKINDSLVNIYNYRTFIKESSSINISNMNISQIYRNKSFEKYPDYSEVIYTIKYLLGYDNKVAKIKDTTVNDFMNYKNKFKSMSEKLNNLPKWSIEKKVKNEEGYEYFYSMIFGKTLNINDEIKIKRLRTEQYKKSIVLQLKIENIVTI